jgi:ABC-2 type transport system ATP-binding protein
MAVALEVNNLTKSYNGKEVLHGISFSVQKGEIFALLGANGAGKTTSLECIEGLKKYDNGTILFPGLENKKNIHEFIGIQLQSTALPSNITVLEVYKLFCKGNKVVEDRKLLHQFGLNALLKKQYTSMSTGQKRRLHLALALVHNPDIVFLDEPTAGLDVEGQVSLHEEIIRLKQQGKTVILASHDMAEVEKLCDRIAIIKDGRIGYVGRTEELLTTFTDTSNIAIKLEDNSFKSLEEFKFSKYRKLENDYYVFEATKVSDAILELLQFLQEKEKNVLDIKIHHSTLEEKFMAFLKEEL